MKPGILFILAIFIMTISCSEKKIDPSKWSEEEVNAWFEKKECTNSGRCFAQGSQSLTEGGFGNARAHRGRPAQE